MALPGPRRCPWRCPSALPVALLVAVTCLLQGSLLGAALAAGGAWWGLRSRPPARRSLARGSPARFLPPQRPPRLQLPPYRPRPSLIAHFPSSWDQAAWRLTRKRASKGGPATVIGRRASTPTRSNCLGRAPPQIVRHPDSLPQDRSPETIFPPKRMCARESPQSSPGSCCEVPLWPGREWESLRPEDRTPGRANKAVQTEEAVERPEEKRQQSPSPPPSLGKGRPRRRSICLLVPGETHPLVLFPELIPGYPTTEMILEKEREAVYQHSRQLLGPKAAITQACSGTSRTQAASVSTTSVGFGQAASATTGLTHTTQPRSRRAPVLPETPAPFSGQRHSGLGRDAASSGSSTSASSSRARSKDRACKRHKARIPHFCNK